MDKKRVWVEGCARGAEAMEMGRWRELDMMRIGYCTAVEEEIGCTEKEKRKIEKNSG